MSTPSGLNRSRAAEVAEREDQGIAVHLRDETGEPLFFDGDGTQKPVQIVVAGTYSRVYRRAADVQREQLLKRRQVPTGDLLSRQQTELVARCILSWQGIFDGEQPYPLSKEHAVALLTDAPWIQQQLEDAMQDHSAFFGKPSPS